MEGRLNYNSIKILSRLNRNIYGLVNLYIYNKEKSKYIVLIDNIISVNGIDLSLVGEIKRILKETKIKTRLVNPKGDPKLFVYEPVS